MEEIDLKEAILEIVGDDPEGTTTARICRQLRATPQQLGDVFEELAEESKLLSFAGLWMSPAALATGTERFLTALRSLHGKTPGLTGIPREKIVHVAGLTWAGKNLDRILSKLSEQGLVSVSGGQVREQKFKPELPTRQREFLDRVLEVIQAEEMNVPTPPEIARAVVAPAQAVAEILQVGVRAGELIQAADNIFFTVGQVEAIKVRLREALGRRPFSPAEAKEALGTSRKYIIPILEVLDEQGFTERREEDRVIRGNP